MDAPPGGCSRWRAELLTPNPDGTLWLFTTLLGMYETHRERQSVYLRGYEDRYQGSLKITEAPQPGLGHAAQRTRSPEALDRRARSLQEANVDISWTEDEFGYGKTLRFRSPDGHHLSETPARNLPHLRQPQPAHAG